MNDNDDANSTSTEPAQSPETETPKGNLEDLEAPVQESNEPSLSEDSSEDTGENAEVQEEPPVDPILFQKGEVTSDAADISTSTPGSSPPQSPSWTVELERFHNDMNGLLAAKENYKIVAVNLSARQSFYRKWSLEANQVMRITAILRRRLQNSKRSQVKPAG